MHSLRWGARVHHRGVGRAPGIARPRRGVWSCAAVDHLLRETSFRTGSRAAVETLTTTLVVVDFRRSLAGVRVLLFPSGGLWGATPRWRCLDHQWVGHPARDPLLRTEPTAGVGGP